MYDAERLSRRKFLSFLSATAFGAGVLLRPEQALAQEGRGGSTVFCDDLGRNVRIPNTISSVTPTGIHAQTLLTELCPEKIASLALEISADDADDYEDADMGELAELPETGTLLSTSDTDIDSEEVEYIAPTIMLDVGLPKEGLADALNALQLETNVPYVFIDISFGRLPQAYRTIGRLLGCEQRAETLATYVEAVMSEVGTIAADQENPPKVFYAQRECGLEVTGGSSLQLDAISYAGASPVTEPYDYAAKTIRFDALVQSEVDWVLFDDTAMLEPLLNAEGRAWDVWSGVLASCGAAFAVSPALYHSWLGSLVYAQSIGLLWLCSVLWPPSCGYDIEERAHEFYGLFYGLGLAEETAHELVGELPEEVVADIPDPSPIDDYAEEVLSDEQ
jgi:iron complex transport system substrate-binding protein